MVSLSSGLVGPNSELLLVMVDPPFKLEVDLTSSAVLGNHAVGEGYTGPEVFASQLWLIMGEFPLGDALVQQIENGLNRGPGGLNARLTAE